MDTAVNGLEAPTPQQRAGMRHAIFAQCFGCLALLAYRNGIMLVFLFLARECLPVGVLFTVGLSHLLFGLVYAVSSVAISTEMLALIPPDHKSLSTSLCMVLMRGGGALSGLLAAYALKLGLLRESWTLWGRTMSSYDALLLACGVMVVLLVVTLGLVPSVLNKSQWVPQG